MNAARTRTWTIGLSFILLGTLGAFVLGKLAARSLLLPAAIGREEVRNAPDLLGESLADARRKAEDAGSALDVLGLSYSSDVDSGEVMVQYPPEGFPLDQGQPVEVLVSAGPAVLRMPELEGLPERSALRVLELAGIPAARIRTVPGEGLEKGAVVSSRPRAGEEIGERDTMVLAVSRGPAIVEVPNVIGKSPEEAGRILEAVELRVARRAGEDETAPPVGAVVLEQNPPAGGLARTGSSVALRVGVRRKPAEDLEPPPGLDTPPE